MSDEANPLNDFAQQLLDAAGTYRSGPESERAGAHDALAAVLDYLRAVGTESAIRLPLQALLAALEDADMGKANRRCQIKILGIFQSPNGCGNSQVFCAVREPPRITFST